MQNTLNKNPILIYAVCVAVALVGGWYIYKSTVNLDKQVDFAVLNEYNSGGSTIKPAPTHNIEYNCPKNAWIDCMPGPDKDKNSMEMCSTKYLTWAKENCPGFQGAAY